MSDHAVSHTLQPLQTNLLQQTALGRVSLTTDGWSTANLTPFLGVTAHYIVREEGSNRLVLRSGLLAFRHIKGPHTGENLAGILFGIICETGIANRVSNVCLHCRKF